MSRCARPAARSTPSSAGRSASGRSRWYPACCSRRSSRTCRGRFNLNDLVDDKGQANEVAVEVFQRLLEAAGLERTWASAFVDWIDSDINQLPGGGEDGLYSGRPAYRPPNRVVVTPSELLALHGFGAERYAKIAPYVTALPRGTPINLCTASGLLLDAVTDERQWGAAPDALARNRSGKCFPRKQGFENFFRDRKEFDKVNQGLGLEENSQYFQLRTLTSIGTSEFALYSLLRSESAGPGGARRVRVVMRSFTE
ncbi:MAG: general secretion pathway protein GspK [Steroidobacteraceae bacterium]